ncbi:MAG: fumarylacetoacetate hydrolase family protein [Deltaproteobacteria bacterium]|nr:fumarylacetoacetate hydrolase family protein [Deltaproteobacteria bacterium]
MKIVRFIADGEDQARIGLLEEETVFETSGGIFGPYKKTGASFAADQVSFLAPCDPSKVVCVGLNYKDHAEESSSDLPEEPLLFLKPSSAVIGPGDDIVLPSNSRRIDFEAELAVVMGKRAKGVSQAESLEYVLGYTCLNDVSARDFQMKDGQWTRAKGHDTFCPMGPAIVTGLDPTDLAVQAVSNGEIKQDSRTSFLIFNVPHLIEYISRIMTLEPGDIIATGTPAGVGPLAAGDTIEIKVEGVGSLVNPVVAES